MSKVIMMCGVCGSGKTTYAKKKEQEGYIRLSIDEEMWKLYGRKGIDYPEEQYEKLSEQVEAALQKKLLSLIQQGKDVVIDFSFWSKENRNFYKELIQKAGAETELVYMKASKELLQKRLYKRNQVLNANSPFVITDEILEHHYHAFQEPCGEGEKVILQKEDIIQYEDHSQSATGFLWFDKNQNLEVAQHWQNHFRWALGKFNKTFKDELPDITPHVCRHTFCSMCVSGGMAPKTLQTIMGHSGIEITLNVYTHLETGDILKQFGSLKNNHNYDFYSLSSAPALMASEEDDEEETSVPDFSEEPDDDD